VLSLDKINKTEKMFTPTAWRRESISPIPTLSLDSDREIALNARPKFL